MTGTRRWCEWACPRPRCRCTIGCRFRIHRRDGKRAGSSRRLRERRAQALLRGARRTRVPGSLLARDARGREALAHDGARPERREPDQSGADARDQSGHPAQETATAPAGLIPLPGSFRPAEASDCVFGSAVHGCALEPCHPRSYVTSRNPLNTNRLCLPGEAPPTLGGCDVPCATAGTDPLAIAGLHGSSLATSAVVDSRFRGNDGNGRLGHASAPEVPCPTARWLATAAGPCAGSRRCR